MSANAFAYDATNYIKALMSEETNQIHFQSLIWSGSVVSDTLAGSTDLIVPTMSANATNHSYGTAFRVPDLTKPQFEIIGGLRFFIMGAQFSLRPLSGETYGTVSVQTHVRNIENGVQTEDRSITRIRYTGLSTNRVNGNVFIPYGRTFSYIQDNVENTPTTRTYLLDITAPHNIEVSDLCVFVIGVS